MSNMSFRNITLNLNGFIIYESSLGKYGLLLDGHIKEIKGISLSINPQELHFDKPWLKRIKSPFLGEFAFTEDFLAFSDSKKTLRKFRRFLKKIKYK
jgi:hypothetical protein